MKSFELLDTLFTRYCKQEDLLGYMEQQFPYPDFQRRRLQAETLARERQGLGVTLDDIYEVFKELTPEIGPLDIFDQLKAYEWNLELENSLPIQCNIRWVEEEDIFVTDHYFTSEQLSCFLGKHGIVEKKIYRFTDSDIPDTEVHVGKQARPNVRLTNAYAFTTAETLLYESPLQKRIRKFRLQNPHLVTDEAYKVYDDQASYTLPILLLFCLYIRTLMTKENRTKVLVCKVGLYQLFTAVFPDIDCVLFSTSPQIHLRPTPSYKDYVQTLYQDKTTLIVDIHGFFQKEGYVYKEVFGCIPRVHVLVHDLHCEFPSLSSCIESRECSTDYLDSLSYDTRGVLFSMVEGMELRLEETKPKPSLDVLQSFLAVFKPDPVEVPTEVPAEAVAEVPVEAVAEAPTEVPVKEPIKGLVEGWIHADLALPPILLQLIEAACSKETTKGVAS